jgi:hypothetical protein
MTHLELLAEFYQAYKADDWDYAVSLQDAYPEVAAEVFGLVLRADNEQEFNDLVENLTK